MTRTPVLDQHQSAGPLGDVGDPLVHVSRSFVPVTGLMSVITERRTLFGVVLALSVERLNIGPGLAGQLIDLASVDRGDSDQRRLSPAHGLAAALLRRKFGRCSSDGWVGG